MSGQTGDGPMLVDDNTAEQIVTHIIWDGLSQHQRNVITEQLLTWLVSAPPTAYGIRPGLSPLQHAMRTAAGRVIDRMAEQLITGNTDLVAELQGRLESELLAAVEADSAGLGARIRLAVSRSLADHAMGGARS